MTLREQLIIALVAALAVQRLVELTLSKRWLRATREADSAEPIPERLFPIIVVLHAAWLAGCLAEPLLLARPFHAWVLWPMTALWLAALALRFWMLSTLGRLWNVRLIRRRNQPVITSGPYRFLRHPNYLALIVEIAAVPLMVGAYWTALLGSVANAIVLAIRIRSEEAYLLGFPAYRAAFGDKKRLLPGVF